MERSLKIPFYAQAALVFISVFALVFTLWIGRAILVPLVYATILAVLLNPLVNYLVRKGVHKVVAIILSVSLIILSVLALFFLVTSQIIQFSESYPALVDKVSTTGAHLIHWIAETFTIKETQINLWLQESQQSAIDNFAIAESLTEVGRIMIILMVLPVYLIMILYYKPLLIEFVYKLFQSRNHTAVVQVLDNTKQIIQTYLVGLSFEVIIMAVLHTAGLLLLGIQYAIILGIIGALLNIIPYIGGIVATLLAMTIAFVTKDSLLYPLLVLILYGLIQFVDNNFIVPKIVAARVQLNALVSVVVVLMGGALWGISGMFLSIPLTAILKVIFDHIESLKPWGFLLGNIVPTTSSFGMIRKK